MLTSMFVAEIPLLERVFRAALIYLFALLALRAAGKRELGQFSTFDLVVVLFFANVLQNSIQGPDNSVTGGVIGAGTMLTLNRLTTIATYRWQKVRTFFAGKPAYLIKGGELKKENLHRELITVEEVMMAARQNQVFELDEVEDAILEPDGMISVRDKKPEPDEMHDVTMRRLEELQSSLKRIEEMLGGRNAPAPA